MYWGLAVEKKAEKLLPPDDFKPDLFADIIKRQKHEVERGWRILMIGIVFEVVAALGISIISGLDVAGLGEKAAAANFEAKVAETNAAASFAQAAEANERAKKFDADRVMVEREAEEIRQTNFVLQAKLLEMQGAIHPREITTENRDTFVGFSKPFSKKPIWIMTSNAAGETFDFASAIRKLFDDAGYGSKDWASDKIPYNNPAGTYSGGFFNCFGMQMQTTSKATLMFLINPADRSIDMETIIGQLAYAFKNINIETAVITDGNVQVGSVIVFIRNKEGF